MDASRACIGWSRRFCSVIVTAALAGVLTSAHGTRDPLRPVPKVPRRAPPSAPAQGGNGTYRGPGEAGLRAASPRLPSCVRSGAVAGGLAGPAGVGGPVAASTGAAAAATSETSWSAWWELNQHPYLDLARLRGTTVLTGSDEFFLARGGTAHGTHRSGPSRAVVGGTVVPALRAALERDRDAGVTTAVLLALAQIGDAGGAQHVPATQALLVRHLTDGNRAIAETATIALGVLADDAALDVLAGLARDDEAGRKLVQRTEVPVRTRAFAAYGLGLVAHRTASERTRQYVASVLSELSNGPDDTQRDVRVAAMIGLGLARVAATAEFRPEACLDGYSSRQAELQFVERTFLRPRSATLVRAHAPAVLARLSGDAPPEWRARAARTLLRTLARPAQERSGVLQGAVLALGQLAVEDGEPLDHEIRRALEHAIEDGEFAARHFALVALGRSGGRARSAERVRRAREILLAELTRGRSQQRPWAALGIGVMEHALAGGGRSAIDGGTLRVREALREAFEDTRDPEVLGAYAIAIGLCGDLEAQALLLERLEKVSDERARGDLALALGLAGARDAVEPLRTLLRDSRNRPELLRQTAIGLALLGDEAVVDALVGMLAQAKSQATCSAVASALGRIGDARSVAPLVAMLADRAVTPGTRSFAAVALGDVADEESLPWNASFAVDVNYLSSTETLHDVSSTRGACLARGAL